MVDFNELLKGQKNILEILYGIPEKEEKELLTEELEEEESKKKSELDMSSFFENLKKHIIFIKYTMMKNFNFSLKELYNQDINFIYDMMYMYRRESKSKEFLQMALAGVDLKKSEDYQRFIHEDLHVNDRYIDMEDMEDIKNLSLTLLKGGASG